MIKTKRFKLTIMILLSVLTISCFLIFIIEIFSSKQVKNKSQQNVDGGWWDVSTYQKMQEAYNSYSTFNIDNASDFKKIVEYSRYVYSTLDSNGSPVHQIPFSFYLKNIVLRADISISSDSVDPLSCWFNGTFDGQGHTITYSGTSSLDLSSKTWDKATRKSDSDGIFCEQLNSSGTIKNTRFVNMSGYIENSGAQYSGGIVGGNYGTITGCIVENFSCQSNRDDVAGDNVRCGPLAGYNEGSITNCMVNGIYKIGGVDDGGVQEGVYAAYFVGRNVDASCSIFIANVEKAWLTVDTHAPSEWDTTDFSDSSSNFNNIGTAYSQMYKHAGVNHHCGPNADVPWFTYATGDMGYNGCCIYLRAFIPWVRYKFNATTGGSLTTNGALDFYVPENQSGYSYDSSNPSISGFYGGLYVNAVPNTAQGYIFNYWTLSGTSFTAYFKKDKCEISFSDNEYCVEGSTNVALNKTYYIAQGDKITFTYTEPYTKNGCYKSCVISFTDYDGNYRSVTYSANSKYVITGNNLTSSSTCVISQSTHGINLKVKEKTYSVTFG